MKRSLRSKLTTRILSIGLTGSLATAAVVLIVAQSTITAEVRQRIVDINAARAGALEQWIDERLSDVTFAASSEGFAAAVEILEDTGDAALGAQLTRRLAQLVGDDASFEEVLIEATLDSRVLLSTGGTEVGDYTDFPTHLTEGQQRPYVQEVYASRFDGRPRLTVAAPIRVDGDPIAVLTGHLDMAYLETIFARTPEGGPEVDIFLVSRVGDFVSADRFGREGLAPGATSRGIRAGISGESGVANYPNVRGDEVIGAYRWLPEQQLALIVEVDAGAALAPARRLALIALLAGLFASGIVLLASRSVAGDVAGPLEALADSAERLAVNDLRVDIPDPTDAGSEVGRLAAAFREMVGRVDRSYHALETQVAVATDALEEAEANRALLQAIVDNSTSLIGVASTEGVFQLANRRFADMVADTDSIVGLTLEDALGPQVGAMARALMEQTVAEDRVVETEFSTDVGGGMRHYFAIVFPLRGTEKEGQEVGFIALDRTDRVEAEETRVELEGQLQHAQKLESLGILAGGVAHDFNNLLQAILGHVTLLEDELPPQLVEEHVEPIMGAAGRAAELTGQLLAYAGRGTLRQEAVDVNTVLRELSELIGVTVPKSATFRQQLEPDAGAVRADPAQLSQVLLNLLTNAADALPDGTGEVRLRTRGVTLGPVRPPEVPPADELPDGDYVEIIVADTGVGMNEETLSRIFEPFFTTKETGRGLGLAAVLGIVQGSGGQMRVESVLGVGTTFRVWLPRISEAVEARQLPAEDGVDLAGIRVLLADDEPGVRQFVYRALTRSGAEVVDVENGQDAVDRFTADPESFDVLVLDLSMPVLGGAEALARIRRIRPDVPALISSGFDVGDSLQDVGDLSRIVSLQKPYRRGTLVRAVSRLVERDSAAD